MGDELNVCWRELNDIITQKQTEPTLQVYLMAKGRYILNVVLKRKRNIKAKAIVFVK